MKLHPFNNPVKLKHPAWAIPHDDERHYVREYLSKGTQLTVLYMGADQDGWQGHVITDAPNGQRYAVPREAF